MVVFDILAVVVLLCGGAYLLMKFVQWMSEISEGIREMDEKDEDDSGN